MVIKHPAPERAVTYAKYNHPQGELPFVELVADMARMASADVPALRREAGKQGGKRPLSVREWATVLRNSPFNGTGAAEGQAATGRPGEILSVTFSIKVIQEKKGPKIK